MISQTLSLVAGMFDAIGPGFILAMALPVLLLVLGLVVKTGYRRIRS